ncbi:MAG: hypothetical protein QOI49_639, partial [Verrucomicrobiota bacterium]
MRIRLFCLLAAVLSVVVAPVGAGPIPPTNSITVLPTTVTQDLNTLPASGSATGTSDSVQRSQAPLVSTGIVISQVYGGAGCGTAGCSTYKNDFIELFNRGGSAVDVTGWSLQYAAATGTAWQVTNLPSVSIPAGGYLLVAEGAGANGVNTLPTPDATGTIAMSATAAKVALVNTTTALTGSCPSGASIVDLVGYGATASCFEGAG